MLTYVLYCHCVRGAGEVWQRLLDAVAIRIAVDECSLGFALYGWLVAADVRRA